ncbi:MAG: NTPase [Candidatus Abyssobacteria bacterium SURF_17]|uniref:NTPase n=1 Tax=Candidatus Abyssobacteria bacterium SURF_17 TaxID=2093361 RepID=A0A419F9N5_9BACT|nr:MAG: NTPase [Candidatus Abyssubacteria bacterium SURF_17]
MAPKILLTGVPGIGKTTVATKVAESLGQAAGGFYTEETREGGKRTGFDIITLDGQRATLSRVNKKSKYRVGKYGVDVESIERVAVPAIQQAITERKAVIIDEIGKMELFSEKFRELVTNAFNAPNPVLAVIMLKSHPFADFIKQRPDTKTLEVTPSNRDSLAHQILNELNPASQGGD